MAIGNSSILLFKWRITALKPSASYPVDQLGRASIGCNSAQAFGQPNNRSQDEWLKSASLEFLIRNRGNHKEGQPIQLDDEGGNFPPFNYLQPLLF